MSRAPLALPLPRPLVVLALSLLSLASVTVSRTARAESPNSKAVPIYVLSILTDDADDQADALTQALRSRVRQAPGWSLLETPQSLETLTIALRCPPRPDAPCLQRIGDQLHSDHYVWGSLAKKKGGEVVADVHFWSRGKPQTDASETFSDNLKEASDDGMKAAAAKLFAQLTSAAAGGGAGAAEGPTGALVVHAGSGGGSVYVDGVAKGTLEEGQARVEIPEGSHKVTVKVPGFQAPSLTTNIKAGGEQEVSFALAQGEAQGEEPAESESGPSKPFPTRKVVAYSALGAAAVLLTVAVVEGIGWMSDKNDNDNARASIPASVSDACAVDKSSYGGAAGAACNASNDAKTKSTIFWVTGIAGLVAGGTGAWLLVSDHGSDGASSSARAPSRPRWGLAPLVGQHEGGLRLKLQF